MAAAAPLLAETRKLHQYAITPVSTTAWVAPAQSLGSEREHAQAIVAECDRRPHLIISGTKELGLPTSEPRGALSAAPSIAAARMDNGAHVEILLTQERVARGPRQYLRRRWPPRKLLLPYVSREDRGGAAAHLPVHAAATAGGGTETVINSVLVHACQSLGLLVLCRGGMRNRFTLEGLHHFIGPEVHGRAAHTLDDVAFLCCPGLPHSLALRFHWQDLHRDGRDFNAMTVHHAPLTARGPTVYDHGEGCLRRRCPLLSRSAQVSPGLAMRVALAERWIGDDRHFSWPTLAPVRYLDSHLEQAIFHAGELQEGSDV